MSSGLSGFEQHTGEEWQQLCMRVLREHHGPGNFIEIPDDDRGDGGLEGFALSGEAYQCYAPELEPLTIAIRRSRHLAKLSTDCGKFRNNSAVLAPLFPPGLLISKWILLVPLVTSKEVTARCAELTQELRDAELPYASADIVVMILTLEDFEAARKAVIARQLAALQLPPIDPLTFAELGDERSEVMDAKLARTSTFSPDQRRHELVDRLLRSHVAGRVHRDFVSDQYSELSDALEQQLNDLEDRLALEYALAGTTSDAVLRDVLAATESLVKGTLNVGPGDARVIAEGQVAEWLMRCPLDFA